MNLKYLKSTLFFMLIMTVSLNYAQSGETAKEKKRFPDLLFSPGIIVQHETFLEFNVLLGYVTVENGKIPVVGVDGFRLGLETNLRDGHNHTIAPKIGYEMSVTVFSIRLSAVNYFQNGNSEFRILPELGVSMNGWANLTYGYGIAINSGHLNNVSNHRVGLSFNLDRRLSEEL